jgi:ribosome-binding protein aMBF1 (putative translation factor)
MVCVEALTGSPYTPIDVAPNRRQQNTAYRPLLLRWRGRTYRAVQSVSARVTTVLTYIGANVRRRRLRVGLTQEALAEAADLDVRFLQRVERGETNIGVAAVVALADALGVAPGLLFRKAELPAAKPGRPRKARRRA